MKREFHEGGTWFFALTTLGDKLYFTAEESEYTKAILNGGKLAVYNCLVLQANGPAHFGTAFGIQEPILLDAKEFHYTALVEEETAEHFAKTIKASFSGLVTATQADMGNLKQGFKVLKE